MLEITIVNPTSAILRTGPSLAPEPVTATTSPAGFTVLSIIPLTSVNLSDGLERARTHSLGHMALNRSKLI